MDTCSSLRHHHKTHRTHVLVLVQCLIDRLPSQTITPLIDVHGAVLNTCLLQASQKRLTAKNLFHAVPLMAWLWNFISGFTSSAISHTRRCNGSRHLAASSRRQTASPSMRKRFTQLKPMSSGLPVASCRRCKTCCKGDCPQAISGGLPNQRESLVLFLHLSSSLGQPSVGRETHDVSGATLEAAGVECGTDYIDERCDGLAGLTVDDALHKYMY